MMLLRFVATVLLVLAALITRSHVNGQSGLPGPDDEVILVQIGDSIDVSAGESSVWFSLDLDESAYVSITLTSALSEGEDLTGYLHDAQGEEIGTSPKNLLLTPGRYYLEEAYGAGDYHLAVEQGVGLLGPGETTVTNTVVSAEEKFSQSLDLSEGEIVAIRLYPARPIRVTDLVLTILDSQGKELPSNARLFLTENSILRAGDPRFYFLVPASDTYQVNVALGENPSVLSMSVDVIVTRFGQMKPVEAEVHEFTGSSTSGRLWTTPLNFEAGELWLATVLPSGKVYTPDLQIQDPNGIMLAQGRGYGFTGLPEGANRIEHFVVTNSGVYTIQVGILDAGVPSGDFTLTVQKVAEFEPINGGSLAAPTEEVTQVTASTVQISETAEETAVPAIPATEAAQIPVTCTLSVGADVNLRQGPGTNFARAGTLSGGTEAEADGQATGVDSLTWWHLSNGTWVRSDVVGASGDCDALPQVTP